MYLKTKAIKLISLFLLIGFAFSCDKNSSQEIDAKALTKMFDEIKKMADSEPCVDAVEWTYTSYGSKACGGPVGYIAYATNINTTLFLKKVEEHRTAQNDFNIKWGIMSDCSIPQEPIGVDCEEGKPVLRYQ